LNQFELMEQAFLVAYLDQTYHGSPPAPFVARIPKQYRPPEGEHSNLATRGVVVGMPSVMLAIKDAPVVWIEVKSKYATLSEQQKRVHQHLTDIGHIVHVCDSAAAALADLRAMGAIDPRPVLPGSSE
jgi:hypothetical protein